MNLKVAHLVSVQFGIFIGIVCAFVFCRFEFAKPRRVAKTRPPATERTAAAESFSRAEDQDQDVEDNSAEPEPVMQQRAPALPNEYSPEAVERYRAEATRLYYQQIAPRRPASSSAANTSIAAVAPAYTQVAQAPAVVQTYEPVPETVAYVQPSEVIVYPQQFVAFSSPRRFANRCRPSAQPGARGCNPHRGQGTGGIHSNASPGFENSPSSSAAAWRFPRSHGGAQPQNSDVPPCRSPQQFTSRGKR